VRIACVDLGRSSAWGLRVGGCQRLGARPRAGRAAAEHGRRTTPQSARGAPERTESSQRTAHGSPHTAHGARQLCLDRARGAELFESGVHARSRSRKIARLVKFLRLVPQSNAKLQSAHGGTSANETQTETNWRRGAAGMVVCCCPSGGARRFSAGRGAKTESGSAQCAASRARNACRRAAGARRVA
jgi:hypothetical protein